MKILLTGVSSFTGMWFAGELEKAGHEVVGTLTARREAYKGLKDRRLKQLPKNLRLVEEAAFGSDPFVRLLGEGQWDVLCHHGAEVGNYRSPDFVVEAAVRRNARNLDEVLRTFAEEGGRGVVLTGSYFEGGEGDGDRPLVDFSPYARSKRETAERFRDRCVAYSLPLGKFVIPNPFGPWEEARFTAFLVRSWLNGEIPVVQTPVTVRDNLHVSLLSRAYRRFVEERAVGEPVAFRKVNPSGYVESQGAFAQRVGRELGPRLGVPAEVKLVEQKDFEEPRIRHNTDSVETCFPDWDEASAWDALAAYYLEYER